MVAKVGGHWLFCATRSAWRPASGFRPLGASRFGQFFLSSRSSRYCVLDKSSDEDALRESPKPLKFW